MKFRIYFHICFRINSFIWKTFILSEIKYLLTDKKKYLLTDSFATDCFGLNVPDLIMKIEISKSQNKS